MGIDARMFLVNQGGHLPAIEVRRLAARMCAAIGHEKFFIMKGNQSWHDAGGRHALSIAKETVGDYLDENREWWEENGYTDQIGKLEARDRDELIWTQDGDPMFFGKSVQLINVHLRSRYYGPGYERGDWPTIRMTADFLEAAMPGCPIYYGGDSSGVCAELFDHAARMRINQHYLALGHDPYVGAFGKWREGEPPRCDFCGDRPMDDFGGGGGDSFFSCAGCGKQVVKLANGAIVEKTNEEKSISETLQRAREGVK